MKFSSLQENLNQGLAIVCHLTNKHINLPVLNNILIKTEDKILKLISTNLEIAVSCIVRGKVEEQGSFTIPSKLFADYIALLPKEKIDIEKKEETLEIKCGNFQTKIKGIPASEFPLIPKINKEVSYYLNASEFRQALNQVIFAAAPNESRPEISGTLFNFNPENKKELVLAATDSYRLAEKKVGLISDSEANSSQDKNTVIVPLRTLQELSRIISLFKDDLDNKSSNFLEISIGEGQIFFIFQNVKIISRLIEGNYPNYKQIIPQEFKTTMTLEKDIVQKAVKTAGLFSRSGLNDVHLNFQPEGNLQISSSDTQTGEQVVNVLGETSGEANKLILNHRYLLEGLNNLDGNKIVFQVIDENNPCLLTSKEDEGYLYTVMPIKQ